MIKKAHLSYTSSKRVSRIFGTYSYLVIFVWSVGMVLLVPPGKLPAAAGISLAAAGLLYPSALRRLLHIRWLVLIGILAAANAFWLAERDSLVLGFVVYSSEGLVVGLQMALRAVVVLCAVDGFSSSVDVSEVGGLLEKTGLRGLGFSIGIAFNMLPALRVSATNAWHSLWMRGGLRRQRWRGLQLLAVTIVANALKRGEDIALAAETRAYSPLKSRPMPVKTGRGDIPVFIGCLILGAAVLLVP